MNSIRFCVLPVSDVATSRAFYAALGCVERGVDGDRWAGVSSDHVALSLCGPADTKRPAQPAFAVLVDDLPAALAQALAAGGRTLPGDDGHVRLTDPDGNHVMLIERGTPPG
ncbi:VOC family protein [Amycolatopsis sp. NPDC047767]|uniref:VOC family protein n=1 Tax=Amycolatopsis sp. NPDC047767 TaxID=3156765 RepID=UPI0034526223